MTVHPARSAGSLLEVLAEIGEGDDGGGRVWWRPLFVLQTADGHAVKWMAAGANND